MDRRYCTIEYNEEAPWTARSRSDEPFLFCIEKFLRYRGTVNRFFYSVSWRWTLNCAQFTRVGSPRGEECGTEWVRWCPNVNGGPRNRGLILEISTNRME